MFFRLHLLIQSSPTHRYLNAVGGKVKAITNHPPNSVNQCKRWLPTGKIYLQKNPFYKNCDSFGVCKHWTLWRFVALQTYFLVLNIHCVFVGAPREHGQKESWWIYIIPMNREITWLSVALIPAVLENHSMAWVLHLQCLMSTSVVFFIRIVCCCDSGGQHAFATYVSQC